VDQRIADNVSETKTNSHNAAFETWLSEQLWNWAATGSGETDLPEVVREAMANSRVGGQKLPANGRTLTATDYQRPPSRSIGNPGDARTGN
jgi:hypothetical protein